MLRLSHMHKLPARYRTRQVNSGSDRDTVQIVEYWLTFFFGHAFDSNRVATGKPQQLAAAVLGVRIPADVPFPVSGLPAS